MATPPLSFLQQIYPNSKITTMPIPLFARRVKLISARLYHNSVLSSFKTMADIKIAAWLADAELSTEGGTAKMRPVLLPGIGKIEKERRKGHAENESQEIEVWLPDKAVFFRHLGWYRELRRKEWKVEGTVKDAFKQYGRNPKGESRKLVIAYQALFHLSYSGRVEWVDHMDCIQP
ncbi:hypothetical protein B0O99DRAFT_671187 [Bisporella sp. PMI_857]|nr:hypothetical protein B0O99DRAFT_671187 [Bisporella sp. PMI_857]